MDFVATAALVAVIWKVVDFLKSARNRDWNAVLTQVIVWLAAIGALVLFRETQYAKEITIGAGTLAGLSIWDALAVGLAFGSTASATFDIKKAIDNSDSAKVPPMTGGNA